MQIENDEWYCITYKDTAARYLTRQSKNEDNVEERTSTLLMMENGKRQPVMRYRQIESIESRQIESVESIQTESMQRRQAERL